MYLLPLIVTLLAPPPMAGDAWDDIRAAAADNAAVQSLKLYVDTDDRIVRTVVTHLDHARIPAALLERNKGIRPGGQITHYKSARTVGEPWWYKIDTDNADGPDGRGCELHAPVSGPDPFVECVITHEEVPPALMAKATALVPDGKPLKSKRIVRDSGITTYELLVRGAGSATATLYIRADGHEAMRRIFTSEGALPPAVTRTLRERLPGAKLKEAQHKRAPGLPDEIMVTVSRGDATHVLRFDGAGTLKRHQVQLPTIIDLDLYRAPGHPEPLRPF